VQERKDLSEGESKLFMAATAIGYFLIDLGTAFLFKLLSKKKT